MTELQIFFTLAATHFIAVLSPGPDFVVVVQETIRKGFYNSIPVCLGIGTGILLHVCYSIMGLGIIIATNQLIFTIFKLIGASYLLYVAYMNWQQSNQKAPAVNEISASSAAMLISKHQGWGWQAFRLGFLTNALNVKASIFFLSVFLLIASTSPLEMQIIYGIYLATATACFFVLISYVIAGSLRNALTKHIRLVEKITALLLATMAIFLLVYDLT